MHCPLYRQLFFKEHTSIQNETFPGLEEHFFFHCRCLTQVGNVVYASVSKASGLSESSLPSPVQEIPNTISSILERGRRHPPFTPWGSAAPIPAGAGWEAPQGAGWEARQGAG